MPIRLLMYMTEIWRDELKNTDTKVKKRKDYRLPAIIPMVLYNGKTIGQQLEILKIYQKYMNSLKTV